MKFLRKLYKFRPDRKLYPQRSTQKCKQKKEVAPRQHKISQLHRSPGGAIATPDGGELDAGRNRETTKFAALLLSPSSPTRRTR